MSDSIRTHPATDGYRDGWDRIFGGDRNKRQGESPAGKVTIRQPMGSKFNPFDVSEAFAKELDDAAHINPPGDAATRDRA